MQCRLWALPHGCQCSVTKEEEEEEEEEEVWSHHHTIEDLVETTALEQAQS